MKSTFASISSSTWCEYTLSINKISAHNRKKCNSRCHVFFSRERAVYAIYAAQVGQYFDLLFFKCISWRFTRWSIVCVCLLVCSTTITLLRVLCYNYNLLSSARRIRVEAIGQNKVEANAVTLLLSSRSANLRCERNYKCDKVSILQFIFS